MCKKRSRALSAALSIAMLAGMLTTAASAAPVSFDDVPSTHWAYGAVATCVSKGINSGMGDNKFAPDTNLTRAQFVTMLVNAFYKDEEAAYYAENLAKIDAYSDNSVPWWGRYTYFFSDKGLNKGTNNNAASSAMMNSDIDRYDMAQLVANILNDKGIAVSAQDKAAAQSKITDWSGVPGKYQDAVSASFALNVLSGMGDGSFGGASGLTRAQGCVVMTKLDEVIQNGPSTPVEPQPPASTGEIKVTENKFSNGTSYTVADNGFPTGYLNNGKPITEENILELLAKAETIWPDGITWADHTVPNDHWYNNNEAVVVDNILRYQYNTSTQYACGGFATMISDYLFGKTNNPMYRVTDLMKIRPGDIIVYIDGGETEHVAIATSSAIKAGDFVGRVWLADGNYDGKVSWPNYEYGAPVSEALQQFFKPTRTWEVWSRYPN